MVREKTLYECSHDEFVSCSFTSTNKTVVQYHERRHEMDHLIDQISDVHDHKHFVQEEVIEWLEDWLEYGKMSGLDPCQNCGKEVHELFDQCPHCYEPPHELQSGAILRCGECDSADHLRVMQKPDQRRKQGIRCTNCDTFVAHVDGIVSLWSNHDAHNMGYWEDDDA